MGDRGRCVAWFVLGIALLEAAWILVLPPFRGSDEIDHAYRASAVAHGQWVTEEEPREARGLLLEVPADLTAAARPECRSFRTNTTEQCVGIPLRDRPGFVAASSGAATYHPAYYAYIGTAARPFSGVAALYAMRVASVLLCLGLLAAAAVHAGLLGRWSVLGLVAVALPTMSYSVSVAAPNGPEMAAAAAWWCGLVAMARGARPAVGWTAAVASAGAALCFLRLLGPMFVVLTVGAVLASTWTWRKVIRPRAIGGVLRDPRMCILLGGIVTGAAAALWWVASAAPYEPTRSPEGPQEMDASYMVLWVFQTVGAFPYRDQMASPLTYVLVGTVLVLLLVLALRVARGRERWTLVGTLVASAAVPVALTWATLESTGNIWQGRYGWPLSMGSLVLAGAVLDRSRARLADRWAAVLVTVLVAGQMAALLGVRAGELARPSEDLAPGWEAPAWWLLLLLCGAAAWALTRAVRSARA